ncbi:MAG: YihY/virulence factor BrkB family protein [Thermodesulfobacteriota bacterium]
MQTVSWKKFPKDITFKDFTRDIRSEIQDDNVYNGAAALAYFWMLAVFPAAIFLLTLLPYLHVPNMEGIIMDLLHRILPEQSAYLFTGMVETVTSEKRHGLFSFGIIFTIWSTMAGIYAIMQQLNITYHVKEARSFLKVRSTALLLSLAVLFLVVTAFALMVFGGAIQKAMITVVGTSMSLHLFFTLFRWVVIVCSLLMGFAILYYFGPDVEQRFQFITPGSVLGVFVLILTSLGFRFYLSLFPGLSATYGSIGAVIILMLWLYIMGLAILVGSEINVLLEHYHPEGKNIGEKKEPSG